MWDPTQTRPLSEDDLKKWQGRIDRAVTKSKQFHPQWDRAIKSYAQALVPTRENKINALLPYRHVESKKAQLFHRTPEVQLYPLDPESPDIPYAQVLPLRQKFLNAMLGPGNANAKRALHVALVDALAASGWLITVLGYENRLASVEMPSVDGVTPPQSVKVPVWERVFVTPLSGKRLLIPEDFDSSDYDDAPWLGMRGVMPRSKAKAMGWQIPDDFTATANQKDLLYDHNQSQVESDDPLIEYDWIWYKAALFDETVVNPDLQRYLVLVKGLDQPVKHADSPYQSLDPMGRITDDSLVGYPIHVGTLRDLPDSAYMPSDLVVGEQLTGELNNFRTDLIRNRRARRPVTFVDTTNQPDGFMDKVERNEGPIPVAAGTLSGGLNTLVAQTALASEPRDNFAAQQTIERDWEQAIGVSANQTGQFSATKRTATEVRTVQGNSMARAATEQDRVREYFTALVRKFDTLIQRFATPDQVQKVLGQQGAQLWEQWRTLPGKYAYNLLPDSGQYVDADANRAQAINEYNMLRKDPRVNTEELLKKTARALGYDPATFIAPQQDKGPEPARVTLTVRGEDFIGPQSQIVAELMAQAGYQISPSAIAQVKPVIALQTMQHLLPASAAGSARPVHQPTPHGGSADKTEPINQHQTERTGGTEGVGR